MLPVLYHDSIGQQMEMTQVLKTFFEVKLLSVKSKHLYNTLEKSINC